MKVKKKKTNGVSLTVISCSEVAHCRGGLCNWPGPDGPKDFLGPLFKKLGNHSSFYEWDLGSNRTQKWRKLVVTSFRSLRELSFHFSGGTTAIKAWNVGREGHQLFQKIMKKDYLWWRKKCSQNIWTVAAEIIWDHFEIRDTTVIYLPTFSEI